MIDIINLLIKETKSKKINLIISGGNSPTKFLDKFTEKKSLVKNTSLFLTDERLIKKNSHTNFNKVNKIFKKKKIFKKIHTYNSNSLKLKNRKKISNLLKKKKIISLIGVGKDGHIASIFSKSKKIKDLLNISKAPNLHLTEKLGKPKCLRITMNISMILKSKKIFLIINSKKKLKVLMKALQYKDSLKHPVYALFKNAKNRLNIFDSKTLKRIKSVHY